MTSLFTAASWQFSPSRAVLLYRRSWLEQRLMMAVVDPDYPAVRG
jgi:hypothetical protein